MPEFPTITSSTPFRTWQAEALADDLARYNAFRTLILVPLNNAYLNATAGKITTTAERAARWDYLHWVLHTVLGGVLPVEQIRSLPTWRAVWNALPDDIRALDEGGLNDMAAHAALLVALAPGLDPNYNTCQSG